MLDFGTGRDGGRFPKYEDVPGDGKVTECLFIIIFEPWGERRGETQQSKTRGGLRGRGVRTLGDSSRRSVGHSSARCT